MSDPLQTLRLAEESMDTFDFEAALKLYTRAIQEANSLGESAETAALKIKGLKGIGWILWMKGAAAKAIEIYESALKTAKSSGELEDRIHLTLSIAKIYIGMGNDSLSSVYLEQVMEFARESGQRIDMAEALYLQGITAGREGEHDAAKNLFASALSALKEDPATPRARGIRAGIMTQKGLKNFRKGEYDEAIALYEASLAETEEDQISLERAEAFRYLGVIHSIRQDFAQTLRNHAEALRIFKKAGYLMGQAKAYSSIGQTYLGIEDMDRSIFFLKKAAQLYVELRSNPDLAAIYSKLGDVYILMRKFDLAVKYYLKDLKISRELQNQHGLAYTYKNLGMVYRLMGETAQVYTYLNKSQDLFEKFDDQRNIASVYFEMALACIEGSEFEDGKEYADAAFESFEATGRHAEAGKVQMLYGMMCKGLGHFEEGHKYFEKSAEMLSIGGGSSDFVNSLFEHGKLYEEERNTVAALDCFKRAYRVAADKKLESQIGKCLDKIQTIDETEIINISIEQLERSGRTSAI